MNGERGGVRTDPQPVPLPEKNEKTHHTLFATLTQANPLQAGGLFRRRHLYCAVAQSCQRHARQKTRLRPSFLPHTALYRRGKTVDQPFRLAVMMFSHADADGHRQRLVFANRSADPLRQYQRAADRRMGQKAETLLHPSDKFYLRGRPTFPEYERAPAGPHRLLMAVNIINALEMIDID